MGLKNSVIGLLVSAFVMAIAWSMMDMGVMQEFTQDFLGKVLVSVAILIISKIISAMLGGRSS